VRYQLCGKQKQPAVIAAEQQQQYVTAAAAHQHMHCKLCHKHTAQLLHVWYINLKPNLFFETM
jgi:hypothetical protein